MAKKDIKSIFAPLLALPAEKVQYINNMIFNGSKIMHVIHVLQNDYGIMQEYKPATMRIYLHKYKKEFKEAWHNFNKDASVHPKQSIPDELLEHVPVAMGDPKLSEWIPYGEVTILLDNTVTKFDALQEMERVALMQYERVLKGMKYEEKLPESYTDKDGNEIPLYPLAKGLRFELETVSNMFKNITQLQMELGIKPRIEAVSGAHNLQMQPYQKRLLEEFSATHHLNELTTQALELITGKKRDEFEEESDEISEENKD